MHKNAQGHTYVFYDDVAHAKIACDTLDNKMIGDSQRPLRVDYASRHCKPVIPKKKKHDKKEDLVVKIGNQL